LAAFHRSQLVDDQQQDKEALDDLSMELDLADEEELVMSAYGTFSLGAFTHHLPLRYRVGDAFLHVALDKAQDLLTQDQETLDAERQKVRDSAEDCEKTMKELKIALYAKFGKAINLDA
jgi:prefoldin subunit 4